MKTLLCKARKKLAKGGEMSVYTGVRGWLGNAG